MSTRRGRLMWVLAVLALGLARCGGDTDAARSQQAGGSSGNAGGSSGDTGGSSGNAGGSSGNAGGNGGSFSGGSGAGGVSGSSQGGVGGAIGFGGSATGGFGTGGTAGREDSGTCAGLAFTAEPRPDQLGCVFQLPLLPMGQALDPNKVNVEFTPGNGARRTLLFVLSAADCSKVSDGWYYDNPAVPTEIVICPDTCAAFQGGRIEILLGCTSVTGP